MKFYVEIAQFSVVLYILLEVVGTIYEYKIWTQAYNFARQKGEKIGFYINKNIELHREINSSNTIVYNLNFISNMELKYIYRSNLNHLSKHINIYTLILFSIALAMSIFYVLLQFLRLWLPAMIIALIFFFVPFIIIELICKKNSFAVRQQYMNFISYLNRWITINDNILYGIEKTIESGIGKPLDRYLEDFLRQVRLGMNISEALEILRLKANNSSFTVFVYNIQQVLKSRGDVPNLIMNLEYEAYKLEEEYTRRKLSTYGERIIVNVTYLVVLFTGYYMLNTNKVIAEFYLRTTVGKYLIVLFSLLFFLAFILTIKMSKFED